MDHRLEAPKGRGTSAKQCCARPRRPVNFAHANKPPVGRLGRSGLGSGDRHYSRRRRVLRVAGHARVSRRLGHGRAGGAGRGRCRRRTCPSTAACHGDAAAVGGFRHQGRGLAAGDRMERQAPGRRQRRVERQRSTPARWPRPAARLRGHRHRHRATRATAGRGWQRPEKLVDFGHRAVHEMTVKAKSRDLVLLRQRAAAAATSRAARPAAGRA